VFEVFDTDGSRTLSVDELARIVQGSQFTADLPAARRKVMALLPAGEGDGGGGIEIDFPAFVGLAKRFPNVLFPQVAAGAGGSG